MTTDHKTMVRELMQQVLNVVSTELEVIEPRKKRSYAKEKLIKNSEDNWGNSKYVYGISAMIACIHETDESS